MKNLGHEATKEEIKTCLKDVDSDDDGELSFSEFITLMTRKLSNTAVSQELKEVSFISICLTTFTAINTHMVILLGFFLLSSFQKPNFKKLIKKKKS